MKAIIAFCIVMFAAGPADAAVVDAAAGGFTIRHAIDVHAQSSSAYQTLVERVSAWWQSDHTFSGNAANLSIDARPGGCFCETLPGRGGVRHLTVVYADAGKQLRLTGGLGPLQELAVDGSMTWRFTQSGGTTTIEMTYRVAGYAPGGLAAIAPTVDMVLGTQVARLKRLIDLGHAD
jgi:hypothetical protein